MTTNPTAYAARRTPYIGGIRDGDRPLEPVSCLVEGHERLIVIGDTTHVYRFKGKAFVFERSFRPAREQDDCGSFPIGGCDHV